jgi:hypothetical protein
MIFLLVKEVEEEDFLLEDDFFLYNSLTIFPVKIVFSKLVIFNLPIYVAICFFYHLN